MTVVRNKHKMQTHLATRCLAGSLVKTLLPQEIFADKCWPCEIEF